jgi:hypothetical protein
MIDDLIIEGGPVEATLTVSSNIPMPDRIIVSTPSETRRFVPRAIIDLLRAYDEHRRQCTPCACGIHCPVEQAQWAEIRKRLYSLDGGE